MLSGIGAIKTARALNCREIQSGTIFQLRRVLSNLSPATRQRVLLRLFEEDNGLATAVVLQSKNVLAGIKKPARIKLWQQLACIETARGIARDFSPNITRAVDYVSAMLEADNLQPLNHPEEMIAPIMSFLLWPEMPQYMQRHPLFSRTAHGQIKQGILSEVPNKQGEKGKMRQAGPCSDWESIFVDGMENGQAKLVNHHLLFIHQESWSLALCLRSFVSASGHVFIGGIFYEPAGHNNRTLIRRARPYRIILPGINWQPYRYWNPDNYFSLSHLDFIKRLLPSKMAR